MSISSATSDYPTLFRATLLRTLTRSLAQVQAATSALTESVRDQALHILTFALKLDEAWPATRDLLLHLAWEMERVGHQADWLPYMERGIQCSQRQGDVEAEAELAFHIGHLYRLGSNFALAHRWLNTSVELFTQAQQPRGQARSLNQLAYLAFLQRDYQRSATWLQSALALLADDDPEQATAHNTLGVLAAAARQWSEAERHHRQALQIRQQQGDNRRASWSLQNLGSVLREQGDYVAAGDCYRQALAALDALSDPFNAAIVAMNLGIVYAQQGDHAQALLYYERATAIFQKTVNHFYLAKVQVNCGLSYLALADWQQAETAFLTGANLFRELGDRREYGNALDGLGLVYLHQDAVARALDVFAQALTQLTSPTSGSVDQSLYDEVTVHWRQAQERLTQAITNVSL